MPFSDEHTVAPDDAARRITSPAPDGAPQPRQCTGQRRRKHSAAAADCGQRATEPAEVDVSATEDTPARRNLAQRCHVDRAAAEPTPLEQVLQLRASVKQVLVQTSALLRTLKRQRKTSRLVETTLNSLRQLQPGV
jgi:hypothetical protein